MIRSLEVLLASLALGSAAAAGPSGVDLVRDGKAASRIVLPEQAGPVEKHAAGELAKFLEKVTGAKLALQPRPSQGLSNVYLGTADPGGVPLSAALRAAAAQLGPDGFLLAADKDGLRIVGRRPVGVLYGVYDVLKKYAGLRWFAPGPDFEYCPKKAAVAVPVQVTVCNPSFRVRRLAWVCASWQTPLVDSWDWMLRNGMPVMLCKHYYLRSPLLRSEVDKRAVEIGRDGGHCFSNLLNDGLFEAHPEYFPLIDGRRRKQQIPGVEGWPQPCTSNPRVPAIMAESLRKIYDTPPNGIYLIGNNDDPHWCQCAGCLQLDPPAERQKGFVSTRYYTLINQIAGEVYKFHPEAQLWAWAYQNYQYPPTGVVPDPRLSIEAAIHGRCYRHSMADLGCPANDRFRELLAQWRKFKNPVSTLEYLDATVHPLYLPIEKVFADDIKYYKKIGLAGVALFTVPPDGTFGPLWQAPQYRESMLAMWQTYYIAAQLLWDAQADYAQIYEDMGSKYYGAAWPLMRRYRALLAQCFLETTGHVSYGHRQYMIRKCLEKPGAESRLLAFLAEAEQAAGSPLELRRVQRDRRYFQTYWQGFADEARAKSLPEVTAARRTGRLVIDGRFDEEDWKKTDFTTNFLRPDGQGTADPQTFVKVLYDADNVYFAVEAMEPQVGRLRSACTDRDGPVFNDSTLEFFVAAPTAGGQYCQIAVNPRGTVYDAMNVSAQAAQVAFDAHAEIKTAVLADRWVAEVRLPTAALGQKLHDGMTWKINVARSRKLTGGAPSQASSWSNGEFHNSYAYRPVVFGGTALVRNGDFEQVLKASEKIKNPSWRFQDDLAPAHWSFTERGHAAVIEGGAASGRRFYRGEGWLFQLVDLPEPFRGDLKIRLMARGRGTLRVAMFQYDRNSRRHVGTVTLKEPPLDAKDWTRVEAAYHCADDKVVRIAFHLQGAIDVDDVSVMPEAAIELPRADAVPPVSKPR